MGGNEIHGEIEGWDNSRLTAVSATDDLKHVALINAQLPKLRVQASNSLSAF